MTKSPPLSLRGPFRIIGIWGFPYGWALSTIVFWMPAFWHWAVWQFVDDVAEGMPIPGARWIYYSRNISTVLPCR